MGMGRTSSDQGRSGTDEVTDRSLVGSLGPDVNTGVGVCMCVAPYERRRRKGGVSGDPRPDNLSSDEVKSGVLGRAPYILLGPCSPVPSLSFLPYLTLGTPPLDVQSKSGHPRIRDGYPPKSVC